MMPDPAKVCNICGDRFYSNVGLSMHEESRHGYTQ